MTDPIDQVPRYHVCGVPIAAVDPESAARLIVGQVHTRRPGEFHLCNAYTLSLVDSDPGLRSALDRATLNFPDGTPVAWLGRSHGTSGPVRGPALVGAVARAGLSGGLRHYFYGGGIGTAQRMAERLSSYAPGLRVAGVESPPFRDLIAEELAELGSRIRAASADIVWIGLGTPRQDYIVAKLAAEVSASIVPVGAAFDFWSGRVPEAPSFLHGTGLEWLYRLAKEPSRLWRRYLVGNPRFARNVMRHHRAARKRRSSR